MKNFKIASALSGFMAALLVVGFAVFGSGTAFAGDADAYGHVPPSAVTPCPAGVTSPDGAGIEYVVDGQSFLVCVNGTPGETVTLQITLGGNYAASIEVAATRSLSQVVGENGQARFRVTIPAGVPTSRAHIVAFNSAGATVLDTYLVVAPTAGEAVQEVEREHAGYAPATVRHPAAG